MRRVDLQGDERILLVRTDHMGDVLLSLPVATALKTQFPDPRVDMLVQPKVAPLLCNHPDVNEVVTWGSEDQSTPGRKILPLRGKLRSNGYKVALLLHPTWGDGFLTYISGIPARIGSGYRAYSFLFNFRVYEHRKHNLKHESEYNLGLLRPLGMEFEKSDKPLPKVHLLPEELTRGENILRELGVNSENPLVIIHPGGAGSALRWPVRRFAELSNLIVGKTKAQVLLSSGPEEKDLGRYFLRLVPVPVFSLPKGTDLRTLASIYRRASLFVGNSTGPMHLAAALGLPVIAIFSPLKAHSPRRWGPLGRNHTVFVPPVESCDNCRGEKCQYFNCMNRVLPEVVFDRVCEYILDFQTDPESGLGESAR